MHSTYSASVQIIGICLLLIACSGSSHTRSLLDDYPIDPSNPLEQRVEMNKLIVDNQGLKHLESGIYCATIQYRYGITVVGTTIINDGMNYGDRTDTIEVEIVESKTGYGNYIAAFIMNDRKDIYSFPESPDSLKIDVSGESIVYIPNSYMIADDISALSTPIWVNLNGQRLFKYDVMIFAKGGRCISGAVKKIPTVEEALAVNLKHEALRGEAEGRYYDEVAQVTRKHSNMAAEEDAIRHDKMITSNLSQDDIDYAEAREQERYDEQRRTSSDLNSRASAAREGRSLLKNPSLFAGSEPNKAQKDSKSDDKPDLWDQIKRSFSSMILTSVGKPEIRTMELNTSIQTATVDVSKGDKITVSASGTTNLGFFAGPGDPNGIDGFEVYSKAPGIRHGSLIGRIGNGDWFSVGTLRTFVAPINGQLQLEINDRDSGNNQGSFKLQISVEK